MSHPEDGHGAPPFLPSWANGRLCAPGEPLPWASAGPLAEPGCYTTARVHGGRGAKEPCADWQMHHVERLRRDVAALGLGRLDEAWIARAFRELTQAAFRTGAGIVRLEARAGTDGAVQLAGTARELEANRATWTAATSTVRHPGPHALSRVKLCADPHLAQARRERDAAAVDESLLVDSSGYLVEGTRTNIVVVTAEGDLLTPDLGRGGVQGIARDILLRNLGELRSRHIAASRLGRAREIIAINAVRGARPIIQLDGLQVGDGLPGPWAARIAEILSSG